MAALLHLGGAVLLPCAGFVGLLGLSLVRVQPLKACATCVLASGLFAGSFALLTL